MALDDLKKLDRARNIVDDDTWPVFAQRFVDANLEDPPLVVLGQGDFRREFNGDDFRVTNLAPLRESVGRLVRSALSFLRVQRWMR